MKINKKTKSRIATIFFISTFILVWTMVYTAYKTDVGKENYVEDTYSRESQEESSFIGPVNHFENFKDNCGNALVRVFNDNGDCIRIYADEHYNLDDTYTDLEGHVYKHAPDGHLINDRGHHFYYNWEYKKIYTACDSE